MHESSSATEETRDGWAVNDRGYIQGGFDTPIFLQAKQRFNSMRTQQRRVERRRGPKVLVTSSNTDPSFMPQFTPNDFVIVTGHKPIIKEQHA